MTAEATVRRAGPDDVPLLIELRRRWTSEQLGTDLRADDDFVAAFTAWWEREADQRVTWLAEAAGEAVGMLNMLVFTRMPRPAPADARRPGRWGYIANVYVDRARRNQAIGRLLIDAATAHADEHDFARLVLSPSEQSIPFYRRAGFAPATGLMLRPGPRADS